MTVMEQILELLDEVEHTIINVCEEPYAVGRCMGKILLARQIRKIYREGESNDIHKNSHS